MDRSEKRPVVRRTDGARCSPIRKYFDPGECFCEVKCLRGHPVRLFNIHRAHVVACDTCKVYVVVGANLMSTWRQETEDIWQDNWESIQGYQEVQL